MTKIIETNFVNINKNLKDVIEKMIDINDKNCYKKYGFVKEKNSSYEELYGLFSDIIIKIFSTSLKNKIDMTTIFNSSNKIIINKKIFASILILLRALMSMLGKMIESIDENDKSFNTIKDIKDSILSITNKIFRMKFEDSSNRIHFSISPLLSYYFNCNDIGTAIDENSKKREEVRMKELNEMLVEFLKRYDDLDLNNDGIEFEEIDLVKEERVDSDE